MHFLKYAPASSIIGQRVREPGARDLRFGSLLLCSRQLERSIFWDHSRKLSNFFLKMTIWRYQSVLFKFSWAMLENLGCARFPKILQNLSKRVILWSLCSVVFHVLTLRLPIQTSLSVAPDLPVFLSSAENCHKFKKTSTSLWISKVPLGQNQTLLRSL